MPETDNTRPAWHSATSHGQITALIADFARFSDARQWPALSRLLAPSVGLGNPTEPPGVVLSPEQFMNRWRTWLEELGVTQHGLVARHIAVFDSEATCFVDALVTSCSDQETVVQWGGQFSFVFIWQTAAWQISGMDIVPLWITESPKTPRVLTHLKQLMTLNSV